MPRKTSIEEGRKILARLNEAKEGMTELEKNLLFDEVCGYSRDKPFGSCERSYEAEEFGDILLKVLEGLNG